MTRHAPGIQWRRRFIHRGMAEPRVCGFNTMSILRNAVNAAAKGCAGALINNEQRLP